MSRASIVGALVVAGLAGVVIAVDSARSAPAPPLRGPTAPPRSSAWLSRLPDGEAKRKFILDCTGCHQFDEKIARPQGAPRTEAQWSEAVTRMLGYAGATTTFPVIAADRDARATAAWLAKCLGPGDVADIAVTASKQADIREYMLPVAHDLPHDASRCRPRARWCGTWRWTRGTARSGWRTARRRGFRRGLPGCSCGDGGPSATTA